LLSVENIRIFLTYFFDKLPAKDKRALQLSAKANSRSQFMNMLSNENSTQVSVDRDRAEIAKIKADIELLKKTIMQMNARLDERDAMQDAAIKQINDRLNVIDGQSSNHVQKNKLRLVK